MPVMFVLVTGGCAGLRQFPKVSHNAAKELKIEDPDYLKALSEISKNTGNPELQKQFRNEEIDRRLRIIDLNFKEFEAALARENVTAEFGVTVVQAGVGSAGALVSQTSSQILSAVSGGLAGTQAAYGKAALFNRTFSAMLAQMIASRNTVLVQIYEGKRRGIEEYPLATAIRDLEDYYFAGSLPGAIVATAADAKKKNDVAKDKLENFRSNVFGEDESGKKIRAFIRPPDGKASDPVNAEHLKKVEEWINKSPVKGLPVANFLTNSELRELRESAVREIPIP